MVRNKLLIKEALLNTGEFLNNDYLDQYLDLISNYELSETKHYIEIHHILPKKYFKHHQIEIDDSDFNLIPLLYKDHCLAHWLLHKCTEGYLKRSNAQAFRFMTERTICSLSPKEYQEIQELKDLLLIDNLVSKEELKNYLLNHSHKEAAQKFNVDINTITYYKKKFDLKIKDRNVLERIGEKAFIEYVSSHNNIETAKYFGICTQTVGILKNQLKLFIRRRTETDSIDKEEFISYLKNHTNKEAAEHFHICPNSVTKLEKKFGLKLATTSYQTYLKEIDKTSFIEYTSSHSIKKTAQYFNITEIGVTFLRKYYKVTNQKYKEVSKARIAKK